MSFFKLPGGNLKVNELRENPVLKIYFKHAINLLYICFFVYLKNKLLDCKPPSLFDLCQYLCKSKNKVLAKQLASK